MIQPDEPFSFVIRARDGEARQGTVSTRHGDIRTPSFMPVGTQATVKMLYPDQVRETGADVLLGNTFHLMLRPGAERVARLGGLHKFMRWSRPILTDSGGFQVMSLAKLRKLNEQGVVFRSPIDGAKVELTPERSMEIQALLGSDIHMQFDECLKLPASDQEMTRAMELSLRWAERSLRAFGGLSGQTAFGIVQGGTNEGLRRRSAEALAGMDFGGMAIGGLAVGESQAEMFRVLEGLMPFMPDHKPRYLMGVGTPDDLLGGVLRGVDMFDCVMPTRAGRHGLGYTSSGKLNFRNARFAEDDQPIDPLSSWSGAHDYSRAYLHHLVKAGEGLASMILTRLNVTYYQDLMAGARQAIVEKRLESYAAEVREGWLKGKQEVS